MKIVVLKWKPFTIPICTSQMKIVLFEFSFYFIFRDIKNNHLKTDPTYNIYLQKLMFNEDDNMSVPDEGYSRNTSCVLN